MAKFQETEQAAKQLEQVLDGLTKKVDSLADSLLKLDNATKTHSKSTNDLKDKQVQLLTTEEKSQQLENERIAALNKLRIAISDEAQETEKLKIITAQVNKDRKQSAKESLGLVGAYEKESKRLIQLRKDYKNLAASGKENTKEARNLKKEITGLDAKLKNIDSTVGQHQRNVGNYKDAMTALPGPIGGVINSVKMLSKVLLATPLGWIIGLIAGAGAALKSFFTGSVEGQERWNKITTKAKGIASVFKDELINIGKNLSDFTKRLKESEGGLGGFFKRVGEGLKGEWKQFKEDVSDKGFWETLKEQAKRSSEATINYLKGIGEQIDENSKRAEDIATRENKLRKDEIANLTKLARLRADIEKLRVDAADKEGTTSAERLNFLNQAIEKENQILAIEERMAKERIIIQKLQMDQGENTLEDYEKLAELEKAQIELEAENARKRRRYESERQTAIREEESRIDTYFNTLESEANKFVDTITTGEEDITKIVQKEQDEQLKIKIKASQDFLAYRKQAEEELKQLSIDSINSIFNLRTSYRDSEIAALEKQRDFEVALAEEKGQSTSAIEKKFSDKEKELRRKQAIQEKVQAIFNASITIAEGILKYSSNPATVVLAPFFAALGAIQLGTIIATPIPQFKTGTHGPLSQGTMAVIGDGYKQELVSTPFGDYFSKDKPQLTYLPKGSEVFSGDSKETKQAKEQNKTDSTIPILKSIDRKLSNQSSVRPTYKGWATYNQITKTNRILANRRFE